MSDADVQPLPDEPELVSPLFHTDQYRTFALLREERPVSRARYFDGTPIWLVTRYEDVKAVLGDPRLANDLSKQSRLNAAAAFGIPPDVQPYFTRSMLTVDPPDHTRLRTLVSRAFTTRRVQQLRPQIQRITDGLLDELASLDAVDLLDRFAYPLPVTVICELLGVPPADRDRWRAWAMALVLSTPDPRDQLARIADGARGLVDFTFHLIRLRRAEPADDLISALVHVHDSDGDRLDDEELVAMVIGILGAGQRTTARLIGNGTFALLTHPDQLQLLRDNQSVLPGAVEELLRYFAPVELGFLRLATEDVEIGGVTIPAGEIVQVVLAAANRDPRWFADPDRLEVTRDGNSHLSFGHGIHFCLGAALARVEGEIAFGALLRRFPNLALAVSPEEISWRPMFGRGLTHLPVRLA